MFLLFKQTLYLLALCFIYKLVTSWLLLESEFIYLYTKKMKKKIINKSCKNTRTTDENSQNIYQTQLQTLLLMKT